MGLMFRRAVFNHDVLALDEACFLQALAEGGHEVRSVSERGIPQEPDHRQRRLPARRERPRGCRAADQRDELPASHRRPQGSKPRTASFHSGPGLGTGSEGCELRPIVLGCECRLWVPRPGQNLKSVTPLTNKDKREYGHRCDQQDGEHDGPNQRRKRSRLFVMVCHRRYSRHVVPNSRKRPSQSHLLFMLQAVNLRSFTICPVMSFTSADERLRAVAYASPSLPAWLCGLISSMFCEWKWKPRKMTRLAAHMASRISPSFVASSTSSLNVRILDELFNSPDSSASAPNSIPSPDCHGRSPTEP